MTGEPPDTRQVREDYSGYVAGFVDACVPEPDSEHVRRWGRQILMRADPDAAARMIEAHFEQSIAPDLTKVAVPTLVLHGRLDQIVPLDIGQAVASAIPDAELVVIPEAGHVPTMTRPQAVVDAIESWSSRLPSPRPRRSASPPTTEPTLRHR